MTWIRWTWVVALVTVVGIAGCGDSGSPARQLIQKRNDLTRERCGCFYEDLGYSSAQECREEGTIPLPPTNECEERAYNADETGTVRANVVCQIEVLDAQAACYREAGCDPEAIAACDSEAFSAQAECPQPTADAMEAFNQALQACFTPDGTTPEIDVCPDDDASSAVGSPAIMGSTGGSDNDLGGSCGGDLAPDEAIQWMAPQTGTVTIDTFGSDYDTVLYVLEGGCTGAELACNDDSFDAPEWESEVTVEVTQGDTLVIVVDGFGADDGDFQLNIQY